MPPEDRDRLSTALERLLRTSVCFLYRTCVLHSSESIELRARHGAVPVFSAPRLPQPHHSPELDAPAWTVGPSGPSEQAPFSDASLGPSGPLSRPLFLTLPFIISSACVCLGVIAVLRGFDISPFLLQVSRCM